MLCEMCFYTRMTHHLSAGRLFFVVAALMAMFSLGACVDNGKAELEQSINEYEDALRNKDGAKAIQYVAQGTFDHYSQVIQYARTYTAEQVAQLSPYMQYHVLGVRAELKPEEVKTFDGRQYMETSISRGYWIAGLGDGSVAPKTTIKMYKGYATVDTEGFRKNSPPIRTYYLKDEASGRWQIDFSRDIPGMDQAIRDYARLTRMSEREAVIEWVEDDIGASLPATVWNPPK